MHQEPKLGLQNQHEQAPRVHKTVSRQKVQSAIYCQREIAFIFYTWKKKRFIYLKQSRPNSCLTQVGQKCPMYFRLSASPCPGTWLSCLLSWLHGRTIWRTRVQAQCLTLASQPPWTPLGQEDGGFLSHVYLPQGGGVGWDLNWEILVSLAWRTDTWPVTYMVQI